ncbi:MAG: HAD family phosphatase [Flavobacteriaceae bacterium]|nr:HAD family phosphatase [Flavobacteriaceae bacterium]
MKKIDTIIFDLGGVLIDWNPKYVYRDVFNGDEAKVDWFLNTICTHEWNEEHDAGRLIEEGNTLLIEQFPEHEALIRTYYERWTEMLGGPIKEGVAILEKLKQVNNHQLYALTNWSAETFPVAIERYDFLQYFKGIVVSGREKTRKPFAEIYEIILKRYNLSPKSSVFIDDSLRNVEGARAAGINAIQFKNSQQLTNELNHLGVHF